jgi:ribosome assembly protein SQT1
MDSENPRQGNDDEADQFIHDDEVLAEIPDTNEDHPMDEAEDEPGDALGELPPSGSVDQEQEIVFEDSSVQHFPAHQGSVFVVSTHPTQAIAVSGGEDDLGYIWDIIEGEGIVKLTGHGDSIVSATFSADGEMVATGGMDGKVRVWRRVGKENWKTWEFLTEVTGPDEVVVCILKSFGIYRYSNGLCQVAAMAPERECPLGRFERLHSVVMAV